MIGAYETPANGLLEAGSLCRRISCTRSGAARRSKRLDPTHCCKTSISGWGFGQSPSSTMVIKKSASAPKVSMLCADHSEGKTHRERIPIACRGFLRLNSLMQDSFILGGCADRNDRESLRISKPTRRMSDGLVTASLAVHQTGNLCKTSTPATSLTKMNEPIFDDETFPVGISKLHCPCTRNKKAYGSAECTGSQIEIGRHPDFLDDTRTRPIR